jgi:hypothetical protein
MAISNYLFSPTSENPRRLSICVLFAKLVVETRNEIIHKHVSINSEKNETLLHISINNYDLFL